MAVLNAYSEIPLGDNPSNLDPEAFDRASRTAVVNFYTFKVLFNMESSSSSSLPVFMKQPMAVCHYPPVT